MMGLASVVAAGNQRWRQHRTSYRPPREPIDPRRYAVDSVAEADRCLDKKGECDADSHPR